MKVLKKSQIFKHFLVKNRGIFKNMAQGPPVRGQADIFKENFNKNLLPNIRRFFLTLFSNKSKISEVSWIFWEIFFKNLLKRIRTFRSIFYSKFDEVLRIFLPTDADLIKISGQISRIS